MTSALTQPLKWHGGKHYLASRIWALAPRHIHYVEPYFGGGSVLLERDPNDEKLWLPPYKGVSEVVNDRNGELMNFWRVLGDPVDFCFFKRKVDAIPLSRCAYDEAVRTMPMNKTHIERAVAFFIRARQSRAGTFRGFTQLSRSRLRRGINGNASEWIGAVDGLPAVHARLQPVVLECGDAIEIIKREDGPGTLFYCDPPYLHETRVTKDAYQCEMGRGDHAYLLDTLAGIRGKFMLSGYHSDVYDIFAVNNAWTCHEFDLPNHAAGGKSKRRMTECVWTNY